MPDRKEQTMLKEYTKIPASLNPNVRLRIIPGHFASEHSHNTHYMDFAILKSRCSEANGVAHLLAMHYSVDTPVDTIVCADGTKVIGTYLSEELTRSGVLSYNAHRTLYVTSPEYGNTGQIMFRDNMLPMIEGKHILMLFGAISTGRTVEHMINSLKYYKGIPSGVCALFSAVDEIEGIPIRAAFTQKDIPDYEMYDYGSCPMCKEGKKIDALVNSYGYSEI